MIRRPRVIPTLLVEDGNLVKTVGFSNPNYLGDPLNAIKIFNEKEVDELAVMDISAAKKGGSINFELLQNMASEAFMPLSYGGGIQSFEDAKKIFAMGFEKIIVNSLLIENKEEVKKISDYFGSQSVIASIDYKKTILGSKCFIRSASKNVKCKPLDLAVYAEAIGAGEILLYSISDDGKGTGYDINTIKAVSDLVSIPVIACGGASNIDDIKRALEDGKADAVAAGSIFVYFGKKKGVLINFPTEEEFIDKGIYK